MKEKNLEEYYKKACGIIASVDNILDEYARLSKALDKACHQLYAFDYLEQGENCWNEKEWREWCCGQVEKS